MYVLLLKYVCPCKLNSVYLLQKQELLPENGFKISSIWDDTKEVEDAWAQLVPSVIVATLTHASRMHLTSNMVGLLM